jgi:hypothetical protein
MLGSEIRGASCYKILLRILLVALFFGLAPISASANPVDWSLTLDNPSQSGPAGSALVFSGTITNSTGSDLLLNTAFIDFTATGPFAKDYEVNFLSTLGIIPPSGYSGPLFHIQWLPGALPGDSGSGSFQLTASAPISPSLISASFETAVSAATPEPSTLALVLVSVALFFVSRRSSARA